MKKNNGGYIVIETLISFMLFLFLIVSILSLVNIVTLQARIHYAMTQAAQTISMYSYVLHLTGADEVLANADTNAQKVTVGVAEFQTNINGLLDGINSMDTDGAMNSGNALVDQASSTVDDIAENPEEMIATLLNYGIDTSLDYLFSALVRPLVGRYLTNGSLNGNEYLASVNVIDGLDGLDFFNYDPAGGKGGHANLIDSTGAMQLVVVYEIEYSFGALPLPFDDPKLKVTQAVKTQLWLGGNGDGFAG